MHRRTTLTLASAALAALTLAGCSAQSEGSGSTPSSSGGCSGTGIATSASSEAAALLPAGVKSAGKLKIGTDPTLPPYEFTDENDQLTGLDVELGKLIGCKLGLEADYATIDFAGLLTAVQAGRYDMAIAGISDTAEREEVLDLVDYQTEGTSIIVKSGNPDKISSIDDLCGKKVAAAQGSVPLELLTRKNESCEKPISILSLPTSSDAFLAVRSGRADASMETLGSAVYYQKTEKGGAALEALTSNLYAQGYQSIAFPKNEESAALRDAVKTALTDLIADGSYEKLYKKWGLEANMVDTITVNDAERFADDYYNVG
jgi:polar amino acid transport system substrate-binding protein